MSLKNLKKSIEKDGIPVYRDRATIIREGKRLFKQGPARFREADRFAKMTVVGAFALMIIIIASLLST
ncbi:MAG: hypothetical protein CL472_01075 [Acidobacteria bacterium]|nr:hypothetical protein [Acidobacteriota bacterium]|tara:strand:+ start:142 stop:345 length:204 start_codon:yes stop_codon:yes gene_type:complete